MTAAQPDAPRASEPTLLRALLWDFDGLVLDTESSAFESAEAIFADHGVKLELSMWLELIGSARGHWTDVLEEAIGQPLAPHERERLIALRRERHVEALVGLHAQPGVADLMAEADAAGVVNAIGSSSTDDWVDGHLTTLGLRHHVSAIVTRDLVGADRTKPHPDIFLRAAEAAGAEPATCVVLEDSPNGVAAARAAGMAVVAVPHGVTADLEFPPADLVVPSLEGVRLADLAALLPPAVA
jgi:HAD superfamily hydrolase (TIGR01509 family)